MPSLDDWLWGLDLLTELPPFKWESRPLQAGGCPRKALRREQGTDPSADFFEAVRFIEVAPVTPDGCVDVPMPEVFTK
jgi:hypothetical protein